MVELELECKHPLHLNRRLAFCPGCGAVCNSQLVQLMHAYCTSEMHAAYRQDPKNFFCRYCRTELRILPRKAG